MDVIQVNYRYKKCTPEYVKEVRDWCNTHIKGYWSVAVGQNWTDVFVFEDKSDALYFGLYWKCAN